MSRTLHDHIISNFVRNRLEDACYTDFNEHYPVLEISRTGIPIGPDTSDIIKIFIHDGHKIEGRCFIICSDSLTHKVYWREVNMGSFSDRGCKQSEMFTNFIDAAMDLESFLMKDFDMCIWDLIYEINEQYPIRHILNSRDYSRKRDVKSE